jgi:predicted dehydrogenase
MPSLRLSFLGAGEIASRHADGLLAAGGVTLVTVFDPLIERAEALARRSGFERVAREEREALAGGDLDAVLVLTPHHLHAEQAIEALAAGKHVICEKPMACTVADCDRMIDAARRSRRRLLMAHNLRCEPCVERTLLRLREGALGRLILGSFRWFTDELARLEDPSHWKGTRESSGGGVLIDGGCHVADLGNVFFGRARRVQALGGRLVAAREGLAEDTAVFTVEYASGAVASFALGFTAGRAFRRQRFGCGLDVDLFGTEGHIEAGFRLRDDDFERRFVEHRPGEPDRFASWDGGGRSIDAALVEALRGGAPPVEAVEARNALAVIEAAYRSLASGAAEEVDWREGE